MAENPMTEKEFKRLRQFIKPFSGLNAFVYKLTGRLLKIEAAPELAAELYLSTLVRQPTAEEVKDVEGYLAARGEQKREAVQELAWALITSAEFRFQH